MRKITLMLVAEAHKEFLLQDKKITTPLRECYVKELSHSVVIVPVLRSGLIMSDTLQELLEDSTVVHLGIYRDESLNPIKYYEKIPEDLEKNKVILCDPLIATGATILKALHILSEYKCQNITILGIVISQKAVEVITSKYPNINIYVAAIDPELNSKGYIVPGVGDAGNRLFGTK